LLSKELGHKHKLPLTLAYQDSGFFFQLKKVELDGELPRGLIDVITRKGTFVFSSLELKKHNARMKEALDETLILSDKIVQDLVKEVVTNMGALYKASEGVAMIDMIRSFAHASILRNYGLFPALVRRWLYSDGADSQFGRSSLALWRSRLEDTQF